MMYLGILGFARSPFARMLAVLFVEFLVRKGFLATEQSSQAVEDAVNIIGFIAMVLTLLIWQWRAHHPAKAQIDVEIPVTDQTVKEIAKTETSFRESLKKLLTKYLIETPKQ